MSLYCDKQRGAVLILLLWALTAVSLIALSLANEVRVEVTATRNSKNLLRSYYMARAGIAVATHKLIKHKLRPAQQLGLTLDRQPTDIELGRVLVDLPGGRAICELEDESGKISINNLANEPLMRRLMEVIGLDKQTADTIVDSILDWIDPDNLTRMNGAEDRYYQSLPRPYRPRNGPMEAIEELLLVRGVTPEIFYGRRIRRQDGTIVEQGGLAKYLTVYTFNAQIDVNSAPPEVLMSIPGIDANTAMAIYERRKIKPYLPQEINQIPVLPEVRGRYLVIAPSSAIYSVRAVGEVEGSPVKRVIRAVLYVNPADVAEKTRHKFLYWNENANY